MLAGQPAQILTEVCYTVDCFMENWYLYNTEPSASWTELYLFRLYRFSKSFSIFTSKVYHVFILVVNGIFHFNFGLFISTEKWSMLECMLNCFSFVWLFETLWTVAHQTPLSVDFSPGKNIGVGCHALFQGVFLTQGSNLCLISPALAGGFFITRATWGGWEVEYFLLNQET